MERRLAAIFAADMVGYSRLMEADERGTMARQKTHRAELIDPKIAEYKGRIVKLMGDGMLVEFASAVDAVACAVEIQRAMLEREPDVEENLRIQYRVGIHVGDIIIDDDDIFGNGVIIAARLEALAEPGGITISAAVQDHLKGNVDALFDDMGDQAVKNIARPIRAWQWLPAEPSMSTSPNVEATPLQLPDNPSIAVLPFDNMSDDPDQEYFADGMTEDIITSLSKLSQLLVIARNSSFTYKGRAVKVPEIARDLGVRYVLEGSVRKVGNKVRITAQLIDGSTGGHLWAERFDRDLTDIFALQDEVIEKIVSAMAVKLTTDEQKHLKNTGTNNIEAYEFALRARDQHRLHLKDENLRAQALFEWAIDLDPGYSTAYAWLSLSQFVSDVNQWGKSADQYLVSAGKSARRAVSLDETNPWAHYALGFTCLWTRQHEQAISEYQAAIALEPNFAAAFGQLGSAFHYAGKSEESIECIYRGMRLDPVLDPRYPDIRLHWLAQAHFQLCRYEESEELLKRRLILAPDTDISRVLLAATYGHLGKVDDANVQWAELNRLNPNYVLEQHMQKLPYKNPSDIDCIFEGLHKAGLIGAYEK